MRSLTIERTMTIILFALIFALAARVPTDTDTWWHLRSGEHILTEGFIYADPFSHTFAGQPWVNHSWGSQLILYAFWRVGGNLGLTVYMAGLATAGMYLIFRMSSGSAYTRAFAIVLGAATAAVFWSPRPQMLSFFLSTVVLYLIYLYKYRQVDRLWFLPPLFALWGNLHAGFSIGFIFLGGFIAGEILANLFSPRAENVVNWRRLGKVVLVSLISGAALVINPYGLQMLLVPFQTVGIGALRQFIQEWNSPNFQERQTWPFIMLLFGTLGVIGASGKKLSWTDWLLLTGTGFLSLTAGRNIAVFAVVATPVFATHLDSALAARGWTLRPVTRATPMMARLNAVIVALVLLGSLAKVLLVLDPRTVNEAQREFLPVEAVEFLREAGTPRELFNSYNWGGYVMFALPDVPVFVDGRTDLYGDEFLLRWRNTAFGGAGWRETLDAYGINTVLVETGSGLALNLADEPGWQTAYTDTLASVFVRESDE